LLDQALDHGTPPREGAPFYTAENLVIASSALMRLPWAAGKAFLDMLGVFAEFETNLRRERQIEGIRAAKERGVYKGRKPSSLSELSCQAVGLAMLRC